MIKRLVQNTVISALAFGVAALLGLLVIPLIIRTLGRDRVRPHRHLAAAAARRHDGGAGPSACPRSPPRWSRARAQHRNWTQASHQITFLGIVSIALALILSAVIWLTTPLLVMCDEGRRRASGDVHADHALHGARRSALRSGAGVEGTVKGFERYSLLRVAEVTSTAAYVGLTFAASWNAAGFEMVAYVYLGTLAARAIVIGIAAFVGLRHKHVRLLPWTPDVRRDLLHRCLLLLQGKLMGGISGPLQPFLIGLLFGPKAVGTYDALVRLSRVSKVVVSLLTSALLPVASRLDERGSATSFQRLGDLGLIMMPMFVVPPLAATAIFSPEIMNIWIGPLLAPYAFWMGLSFLVPICAHICGDRQLDLPDAARGAGPAQHADGDPAADLGARLRRDIASVRGTRPDSRPGHRQYCRPALAAGRAAQRTRSRSQSLRAGDRNPARNPGPGKHFSSNNCRLHSVRQRAKARARFHGFLSDHLGASILYGAREAAPDCIPRGRTTDGTDIQKQLNEHPRDRHESRHRFRSGIVVGQGNGVCTGCGQEHRPSRNAPCETHRLTSSIPNTI